ncbi:hypothetical protein VPH35_138491 [Triticum aestivum]
MTGLAAVDDARRASAEVAGARRRFGSAHREVCAVRGSARGNGMRVQRRCFLSWISRGGGSADPVSSEMCSQEGSRGCVEGRLRVALGGAGAERLRPWSDAGCRTRSGLCRPAVGEDWWWPCTAVAHSLCGGCAVQWRHGSSSACCVGVAAPGESLAGAGRSAVTAPVGVAILLGGAVGNTTTRSPGSSLSGENPDPAAGSGGGVVFNAVPLFRAPS